MGYGEAPAVKGVSFDMTSPLIDRIAPIIDDPQAEWGWIYERNGLKHGALYAMGYHLVAPPFSEANEPHSGDGCAVARVLERFSNERRLLREFCALARPPPNPSLSEARN